VVLVDATTEKGHPMKSLNLSFQALGISLTKGNPSKPSPSEQSSLSENPMDIIDEQVFDEEEDEADIEVDVSDLVDRSVRILPGVRAFTKSLPMDRWAIATSAAITHCHGALERVGITLPRVTVTAEDPALKRGKPFPDPFNLAAERLGFEAKNCLVVEDSPFGIQAAVATGGKSIAVGTSHPHEKIEHCNPTWLLPTLELVKVEIMTDGRIKIKVDATKQEVEKAHSQAVPTTIPPKYLESK